MTLLKYARQGLRQARNAPVQFLVILATLAVGIGANSAMFSIVDAVLLRPLPYPDDQRVVTMTLRDNEGVPNNPISFPDYEDWTRQSKTFASITATRAVNFSLLQGDSPERVRGLRVSPNLLETLGLSPELGRTFRPEEAVPGNEYVAMLTDEIWRSRFAGSRDVIGQSILLGRSPYVVIGVLPPMALPHAAVSPNSPQIVVPFAAQPNEKNRGLLFLRVIGRVKSDVSVPAALAEMQLVNAAVEAANPGSHQKATVEMISIREWIVGKVRPMVLVLFAAVALVLLIACANIASILLGRSSLRSGELAVRTALGATRRGLIAQLLTEAAVLSFIGSVLGLLLGWGLILMARHYAAAMLPRSTEIGMNLHVLAIALIGGLASSLVFGILPAMKASRTHPVEAMKRQGRSSGIGSRSALRALLVAELAITLVLMVGSALAVRSFIRLSNVPPGFDPNNIVAAEIELPASDYKTVEQAADFFRNAVQRVRDLPGVESAAAAGRLPLLGVNQASAYQVEGQNIPPKDWVSADVRIITPQYFRTIGIPLMAGRDYNDNDTSTSPLVAVVNAEFARRYWPNQNAVGHKLQMFPQMTLWREIIGVVGDVKLQSLDAPVGPAIYIVAPQNPFLNAARSLFIVMKVKGSPEAISPALRREIGSIDATQSVSLVNLNQAVSNSLARNRLTMVLLLTFGAIALILAAVGVYGVVGLFVSSRMQEIGIRMALGASPWKVVRLIFAETATFSAIAVAIGVAAALVLARSMRQILFETSTADPITFAVAITTILATTLLAAMAPTIRAMRADPLVVLRIE